MRALALLSILFHIGLMHAQVLPPEYKPLIRKADSLLKLKEYKTAALMYSAGFMTFGNKGRAVDRYNAARAYAQADMTDSAMDCLQRIVAKRLYTNYDMIVEEKDFKPLRKSPMWGAILDTLQIDRDKLREEGISSLVMDNQLNDTVCVYWLNRESKEVFYHSIPPGEKRIQKTYKGHIWIVRKKTDNSFVTEFGIKSLNQVFEIRPQRRF